MANKKPLINYSGMTKELQTGDKIAVNDIANITATLTAIKNGDNYVNNSTTYIDVVGLSVEIPETGTYQVKLVLNILANSTSSIKCQFVGPASTNYQSMRILYTTTSSTAFQSDSTALAEFTNNKVKTDGELILFGRINFVNTGTFKLQFAQATAEAYSTYLRTGSLLELTKV